MPKRTGKSGLAGRLGAEGRKAHESVKDNETTFSGGGLNLPAGIENGIAQLTMCKFDTYNSGDNEGEYYFMARGTVVYPNKHEGFPIQGEATQIGPEPICDTPNRSRSTVKEHLDWVYNELRKLGVETSEIDLDDLETVAEAIAEEGPHFKFRTWQGEPTEQYPKPRVNHQWNGACDWEDGEEEDDVDDETGEEEGDEEEEVEESDEEESEEGESEEDDLDTLAEAADGGDVPSQNKLLGQAKLFNISQDVIDDTESWEQVAEMIKEASAEDEGEEEEGEETYTEMGARLDAEEDEELEAELRAAAEEAEIDPEEYATWEEVGAELDESGDGEEEEEEEGEEEEEESEDFTPVKEEVYYYKPPRARKPVECEVTAVFAGKRTVNLKSLDDGKTFKSVSWDKLEDGE